MTNTHAYQRPGAQPPPPPTQRGPHTANSQNESGHVTGTHAAKKLNKIIAALVALDLVLVVGAVLMAVSVFGTSQQTPSAEPRSAVSGTSTENPGNSQNPITTTEDPIEDATGADSFTTPTGNIICTVSSLGVQCGIAKLEKKPKANADGCEGYIGYVVELRPSGVTTPCVAEADLPGAASQAQEVLEYGDKKTVNNYECTSERTGMKCVDTTSSRGFTLARAGVKTF